MISQKQEQFRTVHYGESIYLKHVSEDQVLWGRGFIDKNIYLFNQESQSLFTIQPKKGLYGGEGKKAIPVVFGAEVLIRHCLSGEYLSIKEVEDIPVAEFQKQQSSSCYFEFVPLRTFQSNGNAITTDSVFLIEHSEKKLYIACQQESSHMEVSQDLLNSLLFLSRKSKEKPKENAELNRQSITSLMMNEGYSNKNPSKGEKEEKGELRKSFMKKKKSMIDTGEEKVIKKMITEDIQEEEPPQSPLATDEIQFMNINSDKDFLKQDPQAAEQQLPIYRREKGIKPCYVENYPDSSWKFLLNDRNIKTPYLQNNDYIFFTFSQENQTLIVSIDKQPYGMALSKSYSQEDEYLCSSVFVVEVVSADEVYLKHYLSGLYFPLSNKDRRGKCKLIPLMEPKKNQYPPFRIMVDGKNLKISEQSLVLTEEDSDKKSLDLNGFWLNKVPKEEMAEIMSLQNVDRSITIQYLTEYLKVNTKRRQNILREFQFIPFLIERCIPQKDMLREYYKLLFFLIKNNDASKKRCIGFLETILNEPNKSLILDLLTELLTDNANIYILDKAVTPGIIEKQIAYFVQNGQYSISFMRIFRVFCGQEDQTCLRNQKLLFKLFFWGEEDEGNILTQSSFKAYKTVSIPSVYKFKIFEKQGKIYFSNGSEEVQYEDMSSEALQYIRQYYYLLSDCMSNSLQQLKEQFKKYVNLGLLLKVLEKNEMKGPCLSLICNVYLKSQKKYKPNIFHKDYQKICEKGCLIAIETGEEAKKLLNFIETEIENNHDYRSTTFRILLNVFKLTIENGYWRNFEDLIRLMVNLDEGINMEPEKDDEYHNSYEDKVSYRNLIKSKIKSISIKVALIDMQIGLWASDYISEVYTDAEMEKKINDNINSKGWVIDEKIFKLCTTNNPELMRKSLHLLYKIYNLQQITYKTFEQARMELNSKVELGEIFSTVHTKDNMTINNYFSMIAACVQDMSRKEEISPDSLVAKYRNLEPIFKYKQVNEQVQVMAQKLNIHSTIIKDLKRFMGLRKKQKAAQQEITYWKLVLLNSVIRNNIKLRDIIVEHRKIIISFLENEDPKYYVAVDILQEIYKNNRKLIISDNEELKQICRCITRVMESNKGQVNLRLCKIINILGVFIETGNRKIVENHRIILKNVFNKSSIEQILKLLNQKKMLKEQDNSENKEHFKHILKVIIYDLMNSMGQKKLLREFKRPSNTTIHSLLLGIGSSNWSLKSKVFSCINFKELNDEFANQFLRLILYDLNVMCESLKTSSEQSARRLPKQVRIYISNMTNILDTIDQILSYISKHKKLDSEDSQETIMIIKIIERLYIIKSMCPLVVQKKITNLLSYAKMIQVNINRKNQQINYMHAIEVIELGDFKKSDIRDKLPLVFSESIQGKQKKENKNFYDEGENQGQDSELRMKIKRYEVHKSKLNIGDKEMSELQTFLVCMRNVNKSDSTVMSNNIKEFLVDFIRSSFLEESGEKLIKMQNILVDYEIPSVICSILEEPFKQRYKLFCTTFALGIKLLEGGHTRSQQKFLEYFRADNKNWIFQNIYEMVNDALKTIEFYYHYLDDPTIKSYEMMLELEQVYTCQQQRKLSCRLLSYAFRFLQLLCENDNHEMKEYVYNQLDKQNHIKYMSKNFIQAAQSILDELFVILKYNIFELRSYPDLKFEEQIRQNIFNLPIFILDFLIEACQIPAEQNQLYLCRTDFFEFVKNLIELKNFISHDPPQMYIINGENIFFQFERKIVILCKSLLQQNSEEIITLLSKKIQIGEFQFFIEESFTHGGLQDIDKLKQMLQSLKFNSYIENIVDILIIKKILKIEAPLKFSAEKLDIINELNGRIQSINVYFQSHSLTVFFPFHPLFSLLSKKTKDFLLDRSANLNTRKQKITELIQSREVVYQEINREKDSEKQIMNYEKMGYLFSFALFLCYLIIFLLVLFYSVGKSGTVLDTYETKIISGLSYMELIVSIIYAILVGVNLMPVVTEKLKANQMIGKRNDLDDGNAQCPAPSTWQLLKAIYIDEPDSAHAVILLVISIYSCFFEVRAYSCALLFVFSKIELLESILKAIRLTWKQLIFVCLLALAFSFIFGFITLNNYIGPLYQNEEIDIDIDRINQHCNSIITCISSLYTQKIIGESVSRQGEQYNYGRFISDLIYWGFFQILLSNIIAAIIIDKFAEQRNAKEKIENDRYSKCYICYADRSTLERRGEDFISHVTHVHNLWNYFFYMYTLENLKDITDFTGIEYWINRQVKQNLIDWVPIDDSLKEENNLGQLEALTNSLQRLLEREEGKAEV